MPPDAKILIETPRMLARQFVPDDLDDFAALCANADVMRFMGDGTTLPREMVARWIDVCQVRYRERGYGTSAVIEKATGRFMGYCGVVRAPDRDFDELIYAFSPEYWGQGYALEMAQAMVDYVFGISQLDAIYVTIDARNEPSLRIAARLKMEFVRREPEEVGGDTLVLRRARGV